jgi:hypothetical protein
MPGNGLRIQPVDATDWLELVRYTAVIQGSPLYGFGLEETAESVHVENLMHLLVAEETSIHPCRLTLATIVAGRVLNCLYALAQMEASKFGIVQFERRRHTFKINPSQFLIDWVRTLTGQRRKRVLPRRSAKPAIGARLVLVDVGKRVTVPAGLSDVLWVWPLDAGWRVERYRPRSAALQGYFAVPSGTPFDLRSGTSRKNAGPK